MGINRRQAITAPPARPPRYSLIGVAETLQLAGETLAGGYTFDPEACGSNRGGIAKIECGGNVETPLTPPDSSALVVGDPFIIWAADECSTLGFQARDYEGRATRMLNASQSYWLAQAFWIGDTVEVEQPSLATYEYDEVDLVARSITEAVARVSAGLAYSLRGERGMIHMSPSNLDRAVAAGVAIRDGNLWVTAMGHVIVSDAGYSGAGPDNAQQIAADWIYGTDMIYVALGDIEIVPGSWSDAVARAQAVDRSINLATIYAERLATWITTGCGWVCSAVLSDDEHVSVQNATSPGVWSIAGLAGYTVAAGGTDATLAIYDAATADINKLVELVVVPANESRTATFDPPIRSTAGGVMYVEPTDTLTALIRYV